MSERMKAARLVVLTVAIAAGRVAVLLAAKFDLKMGQSISAGGGTRQAWPTNTNTNNCIRASDHPGAIKGLTGALARAPFVSGEPILPLAPRSIGNVGKSKMKLRTMRARSGPSTSSALA